MAFASPRTLIAKELTGDGAIGKRWGTITGIALWPCLVSGSVPGADGHSLTCSSAILKSRWY